VIGPWLVYAGAFGDAVSWYKNFVSAIVGYVELRLHGSDEVSRRLVLSCWRVAGWPVITFCAVFRSGPLPVLQ